MTQEIEPVSLHKRKREQLPVMLDFAKDIEDQLASADFDAARGMDLAVTEARHHATRLRRWLHEINYLVDPAFYGEVELD